LPGRCESVPVTIARPPALHDESLFGSRKTAAYEMAILQMSSGERFSCMGTLRDGWFDCPPVARNPGSWTNFVFATNLVVRGSAP